MNIKAGDVVTIREDLKVGVVYGGLDFNNTMSRFCGKPVRVKSVYNSSGRFHIEEDSMWQWSPEMIVADTSKNPTHLHCVNDGGASVWWREGKNYEIHYGDYAMSIIDEEGDPRFSPSPEYFIEDFEKFGTIFEPVYLEPSTENPAKLVERLEKDVERLNKDQLHLFQKRDRIHKQIGKLRNKEGRLERDLNLLEAYLDEVVNPFSQDISKEIEKVVWRLRLDVVRLENKARRINNQAIFLGAKARRLEEDLKVIKKYI